MRGYNILRSIKWTFKCNNPMPDTREARLHPTSDISAMNRSAAIELLAEMSSAL